MNFKQASENQIHLKLGNKGNFEVEQDFVWYIDFETKNEYIIIPRGFKTDLGSIPWVLKPFINYTYLGYIIHDRLYSKKSFIIINDINKLSKSYSSVTFNGNNIYATLSRREADIELIKALEVEGMTKFKRTLVYLGIRTFGFLFYKKK